MASKKKNKIGNHEEFLSNAERYSTLTRDVQFAETSMNEEIDQIKNKYQNQIKSQNTELKAIGVLLEDYALENVNTLTTPDKRSFDTATMSFSFYKSRTITYPKSIEALAGLLRNSPFRHFITTTEKVNKNEIKALDTEQIRSIGLDVKEDVEHLTMSVKTEEI